MITKLMLLPLAFLSLNVFASSRDCETWTLTTEFEVSDVLLCQNEGDIWQGNYVAGYPGDFRVEYTRRKQTLVQIDITTEATKYKAIFVGVLLNANGVPTITGNGRDVDNTTYTFVMKKK